MQIIDTHAHVYYTKKYSDLDQMIERSREAGLTHILMPNVDIESIAPMHALAAQYPNYCMPMMGMHPTSVTANWRNDLETMKSLFSNHKYIAVGEIGVDLYHDKTFAEEQKEAFEEQLRWSIEYDLPVSIHAREAVAETIQCIRNVGSEKLRGVFHSFSTNTDDLKEILSLGNFFLGINGVVTFKNSDLPTVLKSTDISRILIETDAPYLAPMPHRGKRNEPAYTTYIAEKLGDIYGLSPQEIGRITSENAKRLFDIK